MREFKIDKNLDLSKLIDEYYFIHIKKGYVICTENKIEDVIYLRYQTFNIDEIKSKSIYDKSGKLEEDVKNYIQWKRDNNLGQLGL